MIKATIYKKDSLILAAECEKGMPLSTLLRDNNIYVPMPCGGSGACKKCKVWLICDGKEATEVLACKYVLEEDCSIVIGDRGKEYTVETRFLADDVKVKQPKSCKDGMLVERLRYGIAIDIGTTTLAMQLAEYDGSGAYRVLDTYTATNPQRAYGSDVISRIKHANSGRLKALSAQLRNAIIMGVEKLITGTGKGVESIVIAGNATMIYLLMGESCETLGKHPFAAPLVENVINIEADAIFPKLSSKIKVTIIPGASAFVGGDIIAGLFAIGCFGEAAPQNILFLDVGTNAEMALMTSSGVIYCTSAAAGPALEGGNISCGTGSVPGAIAHVSFKEEAALPELEVIKDSEGNSPEPVGLCGSGLIEVVAKLLRIERLDETGLLKEPYFTEGVTLYEGASGRITLTQKDIRELQLAKSAVRAGLTILQKKGDLECKDITSLYLAGGFGAALSKEAAAEVGIIPKELLTKTKAVGNAALEGALRVLADRETSLRTVEDIRSRCVNISLAAEEDFDELFIKYMNLGGKNELEFDVFR